MRRNLRLILVAAGLTLLVTSCDRTPTTPQRVGSAPVVIARLEITAPASVAPGASAQLVLTAIKSDGTREDVTARAQWITSDSRILLVSAAGVLTGGARGEATVRAAYLARGAVADVAVLPAGTFKLSGRITDTDQPLANARIEILSGTGEGQSAVSRADGTYAIYGVAGDLRVQVKRDGYVNQIQDASVSASHTLNVAMTLEGPRPNLAGLYTLTITQHCAAGSTMPEDARVRVYDALIEQNGPRLTVRLSGAELIVTQGHGDRFNGTLDGTVATFDIGQYAVWSGYYYDRFEVVERFSSTQTLTISGVVSAASRAESISGLMQGTVGLVNKTQAPFYPPAAACTSPAHGFEMRRR